MCTRDLKLYAKAGDKYELRGKGTLHIKLLASAKKQMLFRADNTLGTILLNTLLVAGLPIQATKKNVLFVVPSGSSGSVQYLIKCPSEGEAQQLVTELNKHKSS